MTALVGHELRAPLAAALLYVGIARRQALPPSSADDLNRTLTVVGDELQRLERLVSRVLELEEQGRAVLRPQHIDLTALVSRTVAEMLSVDAIAPSTVFVAHPGPITGWWDDMAVEEIVRNLLSNALRFGEGQPIRVAVERVKNGARIVVADRGPGIAVAECRRIFERGVRAPQRRRGGLGVGLWLVRQLVRAHGGRVTVKSAPGQGATFTVLLRERLPDRVLAAPTDDRQTVLPPSASPTGPSLSSKRLLMFGRELLRAGSFADLLAVTGREVRAATGYPHVWFMVAEGQTGDQFRLLEFSGENRDVVWRVAPRLSVKGDRFLEELTTSVGPVVVTDARIDARTNKQIVEQLQNRTLINIPLIVDQRVGIFGIGTFGDEGCRAPSERELDYLVGMGAQIAMAAARIRFLEA